MSFGWDYPPGVTGSEFEIAGPDNEADEQIECPECGNDGVETVDYFREARWWTCSACGANNEQTCDREGDWS